MATHVEGLDNILKNLNKELSKLKGNVQKGLTLAMTVIKGKSMSKTPVDVGNLRASHYLVTGDGKVDTSANFNSSTSSGAKVAAEHQGHISESKSNAARKQTPFAEIGCTAFYAVYVHENVEMKWKGLPRHKPHKGFYWDPQGEATAKFLEKAISEGQGQILTTVKRFAKL
jgi:hypothetical protein